ncbi:MAG: SMI1/KNR4 family protein [Niabella sp.]
MEINKIEDVIVPTKPFVVGTGWEEEILPIIKSYSLDFWGDDMVDATPLADIEKCEKRLGTTLPNDLKLFYLKFGPARLMETLLSVEEFVYLSASWDKSYLDSYTKDEQEVISGLIVFGDYLGNGNLWCFQKDTKHIFYFNHDTRPNVNGMFDNFYDYIHSLLIYSQGEMGQEIEGLEAETEKLVVNQIGKERVKVWQYFTGWD